MKGDPRLNSVWTALVDSEGQLSELNAATIAGVSPRRFRTIFRETFGESFRVMRLRIRMAVARKRLEETSQSIDTVTQHLGYSRRDKLVACNNENGTSIGPRLS